MIRLIALDLDDTLLDDAGKMPDENIAALRKAAERGAVVTIATGRMTTAAKHFAEKLGIDAPMILFNGALVYDAAREKTIHEQPIPLPLVLEILKTAETEGRYIQYFDKNGYYYAFHGSYSRMYGGHIGVAGTETGVPLSEWVQCPALKLLMVTREEDRDAVCEIYRQRFGDRLNVMGTRRNYIEMVMYGVDKGNALCALAGSLGIGREETAAFGDANNDIGMLKWAGMGYCMQNGCDAAKAAADEIAPSNAAHGVAKVINRLLDEGRIGQ